MLNNKVLEWLRNHSSPLTRHGNAELVNLLGSLTVGVVTIRTYRYDTLSPITCSYYRRCCVIGHYFRTITGTKVMTYAEKGRSVLQPLT